jgi:hypothetical protein
MRWKPINHKDFTEWHRWFAWYPVATGENEEGLVVWLEYVDRQFRYIPEIEYKRAVYRLLE